MIPELEPDQSGHQGDADFRPPKSKLDTKETQMSNPLEPVAIITRDAVGRAWNEFEPKLLVGLLSGSAAAFVASFLDSQFGIHLSKLQNDILVVGLFFLGGYISPSSGITVTTRVHNAITDAIEQVEKHTGASVTTVTASTPVQAPAKAKTAVQQTSPGVFTKVIEGTEDVKATEVIPPVTQASAFLAARGLPPATPYNPNDDSH